MRTVCAEIRELIRDEFAVNTLVIARTHDQLRESLAAQPFAGSDEKRVHAHFLDAPADPSGIAALDDRLVAGEELALIGDDLWIRYSEGGVSATKLTAAVLDRALGVPGTARNLRTVRRLVELTAA